MFLSHLSSSSSLNVFVDLLSRLLTSSPIMCLGMMTATLTRKLEVGNISRVILMNSLVRLTQSLDSSTGS
jgi:hypothetical protein